MVFTGIGSSLTQPTGQIILNRYFDKKKARAIGLAGVGGGVGSFILPLLITFLFSEYGYQNGMMLIGAIALNMCVGASLFRPLENNRIQMEDDELKHNPQMNSFESDKQTVHESEESEIVMLPNDHEKKFDIDYKPEEVSKKNPLLHLSLLKDIHFLLL